MSTEEEKKPGTALVAPKYGNQDLSIFGETDFGAGFEEMSSAHTIVPILKIVQALSPQLQKSKPQFNKDAKQGMFLISSTNEVFNGDETGAKVVPVYFTTKFIEWKDRKAGGGIVNRYSSIADFDRKEGVVKNPEKSGWITKEGHEIIEYYDFYVFLVGDDGTFQPMLLSFKGSAIRTAKVWNSQLKGQTQNVGGKQRLLPMFSYCWTLRTQEQSNSQGAWHGIVTERGQFISELPNGVAIVEEARRLRDSIVAGTVRGADDNDDDEVAGPAGGVAGATGTDTLS